MKLVFMGTPEFAVASLDALVNVGHEVVAVYTRAPSPAGRGKKERRSAVHERALELGITVCTPQTLKSKEAQEEFAAFKAEAAVVVAYGLLLPKAVLDCCPCFNIHASLLPRWRGAAPIQRAIMAGDPKSGVTIMRMDEGMDTGDILLQEEVLLEPTPSGGQLHDVLRDVGARLIVQAIEKCQKGELVGRRQDSHEATHAAKLTKDEELINWHRSARDIYLHIQAFSPYPSVYFVYKDEKIKIIEAEYDELAPKGTQPGEVVDDVLTIATGAGVIKPKVVKRAGKNSMPIRDMLRGFPVERGSVLA